MSKKREPFSIIKRLKSFKYAYAGLVTMIRYEHNAWIHILAAIVAISGGLLLDLSGFEWLFVAGAICLVFALELINTAIEKLADSITKDDNPYIKDAKDMSAAAVMVGAFFALIVAGVIIYNHCL